MPTTAFPDLASLVDPLIGAPYEQYACWNLAHHLITVGLGLDIATDLQRAAQELTEVWFEDDPRDPLTLVQPWDLFIMVRNSPISQHVGVVLNDTAFVHTRRRTGVVIEPMQRWKGHLLQLGRLRMLT